MYHSQSIQGKDIPVTGLIAVPTTPPPAGGYPVVSWAHGTSGIADTCAPSLNPTSTCDRERTARRRLRRRRHRLRRTRYARPSSVHRRPERGARHARHRAGGAQPPRRPRQRPLSGVGALARWARRDVLAEPRGQLGPGTASRRRRRRCSAVAAALVYQALKTSPFKHYLLMAAAGLNAGFGDAAAPLDKVLTPAGLAALPNVDEGCSGAIRRPRPTSRPMTS